jgi:hypothetical protein
MCKNPGCATKRRRNPTASEHAKRGAYQYGRAEKSLKKGDTYGAAALAHIAESNFLDGNDFEGVQFAHDLAKQAERASRAVRNPVKNYGSKKRNPTVHAASEDYKLGLFQGAAERGMQPPPKGTSYDLRRGYADGAKVAKALPSARSEALGVYKATGNQLRAADVLYDNAKGGASTVRNPRAAKSPATARAYVTKIRSIAHQAGISDRDAHWALHYPEAAQSKHPAQARIGKLFLQAKEKGLGNAVMAKFEKRIGLLANPRNRKNPMTAAERKHCAHERSEERAFASLLAKMPIGQTATLSGHRVRKLSKGYVVIDGIRLSDKQAAAKIHRGK